ncbi:UNVERIFIED_CONTAM: hypothetical protein Slati_3717900 [Sesamum latifolium]|uniref:Retrotransposon gag domain-containing protein n=1 Tax=Sesamum latifolium TaxID=2727402 RepID=A0AAW2U348_9LAMI
MADELPLNCHTPAIAEYDGTSDPMEHLSRFENAALLHRYTDGIKCRVFVTTFARAAQQWFNQLPAGAIGSFQEFRSLFLHQFASSKKLRKTELSLFVAQQKDNEHLKEYLHRFNAAALDVPSATQEVKARAFLQGLLDGDFFKSLAKKPVSKFDARLGRAAKYINMEDAQAAKKESRGEKRKEMKEETPSKKPRIDTQDKKPPFQREYVCWEKARGTGPYQKREGDKTKEIRTSSPERSTKERARQASGIKGDDNDVPRKEVIRMITGGPSGGDSHRARKLQIREAHDMSLKEVIEVEAMEDTPLIQFGRAERSEPQTSHNDALVITAVLADYEVGRIFIDSGSSADILFERRMIKCSWATFPWRRNYPEDLYAEISSSRRALCIQCNLGKAHSYGFPSSNFYLSHEDEIPTPGGVGEVQGDHLQSRKCYVQAVRKGQKRNLDEDHQGVPSSKKGKETVAEGALKEIETPAKVQPIEELLNIEVIPGSSDRTTRIGSRLRGKTKEEIVSCLRRNGDIFAWAPQDLEGIDPKVITYHLNIDPSIKPVK